ncbi:processed acidic surface protein [Thalassobacillus cyri]|uniref:Processed acidic surface protein n=1 Tax=Thalassobacillus cyri TaxID=571932 RepID=A0A1H3XDG7_9BACI|nr:processed acidic surface protein [Thalassobacillus cyri]SDZ97436.1 processed acidic surface protein [Thalassobacillus cyri]
MKRLLSLVFAVVMIVSSFPGHSFAAINQGELDRYLTEIQWTEEELETYLWEYYDLVINDFEAIEELKEFLGPIITEESLQELLDTYGLTREELDEILADYGETVDDYTFIDDIEFFLIEETIDFNYEGVFNEFGLTEDELDRLFVHLESLDSEAMKAKLDTLYDRLMAFEDFESATELTAGQIAELLSIMQEMLDLFKMDAKLFLVTSGEEKVVTLADLLQMTEAEGYDLRVELYNLQGEFLADFILTGEMFGSELLKETAKDLPAVEQVAESKQSADKPAVKKQESASAAVAKTVKGGELPDTDGGYLLNMLIGLGTMGIGVWAVRRFRNQGA